MTIIRKRSTGSVAASTLGLMLAVCLGQTSPVAQSHDQKVEEVFKNIKTLNGQPADTLSPTMVFFEAALGVGCAFCHENDRELDSKPQKLIARQMIEMVDSINKTTFSGQRQVTCFTCHQGRSTPIGVPNVVNAPLPPALGEDYIATLPQPPPVPTGVTVLQVLDKYVAALGGANAVQQVASLSAVGTVTQRRPGRDFPSQQIEIFSKAPTLGLTVTKVGQDDNLLSYGAASGWAKAGNTAPRDLRRAEADGARLEDPFNLPIHLKQMLLEPQMERPQVLRDGREVYVISAKTRNLPKVEAYFEKETGMLARLVYFNDTPSGIYPTQIEYRDYRDVGGRKVPYQWVISQVRNREYTYAMQTVTAMALDESRFVKPDPSSR